MAARISESKTRLGGFKTAKLRRRLTAIVPPFTAHWGATVMLAYTRKFTGVCRNLGSVWRVLSPHRF